jgi:hypothetical protein
MMRKYCLLFWAILLFFSAALTALAAGQLEKDMAAFDRVYIPALALTSQDNKAAAKKAIALTKAGWGVFKKKHAGAFKKSKPDKRDLAIIDQMITDAERTVRSNGKLAEAHEILEGVRDTFLAIRKRNSIDYYLDYTTRFHEPMETIVLTAMGKTADTLTDAMLRKIKSNFSIAEPAWKKLQSAAFDPVLFSFDAKKDAQRLDYIKAEAEAMGRLKIALDSGDKGAIIKAAPGIKSNFMQLLLMFGDFTRIK